MTVFGLSRRSYKIRVRGHCVYVKLNRPIHELKDEKGEQYLSELQAAVRRTVDADIWALISRPHPQNDKDYSDYVERVKALLIKEYDLDPEADEVHTGNYHLGMLVLSFVAAEEVEYPYYYRGVQLKPHKESDQQNGDNKKGKLG